MPRMKVDIPDADLKGLEDAEYDDSEFQSYDGEIPPKGTILVGFVKKMWWTYTNENGDDMLKILFVADGNEDTDEQEYEGAFAVEYAPLRADTKFRWAPFLNNFGLTIRDVMKKTFVKGEPDDDQREITKIADWEPGSDEAYCRIVTDRNRYEGEWRMKVGRWLPYESEEDDAENEPEEEEPPARPSRSRSSARSGAKTATRSTSRRKAEPEPEPEDEEEELDAELEEEEVEEEEEAPKRPARGSRGTARSRAAKPASKPAARGRGRGKAASSEDEPPF